jgi:fructosamine-3-kinase
VSRGTSTGPAAAAARLLGAPVASARTLHGGDLSKVALLEMADGRALVAKAGPRLRAEAAMLGAIRAAGAPAPAVIAVSDSVLVMEALAEDGRPGWADLGRVLRTLHAETGRDYGWEADHGFGPVAIPNAPAADWPGFWAERRLLVGVERLPSDLARRLEALVLRLPDRLPARPRASLLHGDLWAGNVLFVGGAVSGLIDPACYFGHAEVDLSMLALFGAPGPGFAAAYGALEPDWEERRPIYQLWPAIVHLRLFGRGYRGMVERLLDAAA